MDELELELKTTFLVQAQQLVAEAEQSFLDLESAPGNVEILDRIFRIMHNMKGSANGVGFAEIGDFTHNFESLMLKLKNGEIKANQPMVDLLLKANDAVTDMVEKLRNNMSATFNYDELKNQIKSAIDSGGFADIIHPPTPVAKKSAPATTPEPVKLVTPAAPTPEAVPYTGPAQRNGDATTYKIKTGERFLCFNLGEQEYAIPLLSVKEVIGIPGFTPIPQSPNYFMGITNLRGTVIPVLDLPKKLSIPNKATTERAVIILDVGRGHLGIAVDSVNNVIAPQNKDISPRPETDPSVRTDYIIGVYRRDKQMVLFVDISKALGTDDWAAMEIGGTNTETTRAA